MAINTKLDILKIDGIRMNELWYKYDNGVIISQGFWSEQNIPLLDKFKNRCTVLVSSLSLGEIAMIIGKIKIKSEMEDFVRYKIILTPLEIQ